QAARCPPLSADDGCRADTRVDRAGSDEFRDPVRRRVGIRGSGAFGRDRYDDDRAHGPRPAGTGKRTERGLVPERLAVMATVLLGLAEHQHPGPDSAADQDLTGHTDLEHSLDG